MVDRHFDGTSVVLSGDVVVVTAEQRLSGRERATGRLLWQRDTDVSGALRVSGDLIVTGQD
ncbi:hypothetical protein [Nocardia sp. CC227C]|uniref:hypothetical protein n=1 Tax=Nocardia sp. CC227C TaxID=3044562 RepID=UPI00278C4134|nr:hypothetical protein [Nocardia sp. CC227C]